MNSHERSSSGREGLGRSFLEVERRETYVIWYFLLLAWFFLVQDNNVVN